jgi:hypothetical protein
MATSGTYTYTVTRDDIIREALLNTGKLGATGYVSPQDTADCARKLNMLVKQWMGTQDFAPGLKAWTRARGDLFLSSMQYRYLLGPSGDNWAGGIAVSQDNGLNYATTQLTVKAVAAATTLTVGVGNTSNFTAGDYLVVQLDDGDIYSTTISTINAGAGTITIPSPGLSASAAANNYLWNYTTKAQRPLEIQTCVLRDINSNETPIDFMTMQTYEQLPSKTMLTYQSDPSSVYYEPSQTNGTLYLNVGGAQDVTKLLHIVYLRPIQDFNNPLDNPDYPQEWFLPLSWGLTKQICPMYNGIWTETMEMNLQNCLAIARNTNPETTQIYFMCDASEP